MRVLLISGSTRQASGNTPALRTAGEVAPEGVVADLYDGLASWPAFIPTTTTIRSPGRWWS
jgi:chromate reductase, NAD(P)H dehydrogenase (quinone)